jgi:hypothetical protein
MKHFFTAISLFFVLTSNAQVFDGISVSGDLPTAISKFKAKGYTFKKYVDNGAILNGKVGLRSVEVFIFTTPKSKKIYKFTIYFEEQQSWYSLKEDYERYYEIFKEKYGAPDNEYSFFTTPYEAGDGYEMTAVQMEKATFASYWLRRNNTTIAVSISKWKQVEVVYENDSNTDLKKKELSSIENNSF